MIDEDKISKIEDILKNEVSLSEYIKEIENKDIDIPEGLSGKIITKIKEDKVKKNKTIYSPKYITFNILKIAACTIFAIIIWQTQFSNEVYSKQMTEKTTNKHEVYEKINGAMQSINKFFVTPTNFKEDKK